MIIVICGTSSSGKSSVCEELKNKLDDNWLFFSTDGYLSMLGDKFLGLCPNNKDVTIPNAICYARRHDDGTFEIIPGELCSKLYLTIPSVLKLLAQQGFNIILDSFITMKGELESYKNMLTEFNLHFFYLHASPNVIAKREENRGNRLKGSAVHWLKKFDFQTECDLIIDTEKISTSQICDLILNHLKK